MSKLPKDDEFMTIGLKRAFVTIYEVLKVKDKQQEEIIYTKAYFSRYYHVDIDTFHKWIQEYCPVIWENDYKKKRKFTNEEANIIFDCLGHVPIYIADSQTKMDVSKEVFQNKEKWNTHKLYEEIQLAIEELYPQQKRNFNKIPPKIALQIKQDENPDYKDKSTPKQIQAHKYSIHILHVKAAEVKKFSEEQLNTKFKYFMKSIISDDPENENERP